VRRLPTKARGNGSGRAKVRGRSRKDPRKIEATPTSKLVSEHPDRVLEIEVFHPSPSANQWVYKHWRAYHSIKKAWLDRLTIALLPQRLVLKQPFQRVILQVERRGIKLLDEDNLVAGLKPIIDSLIKLGVVPNDTNDVITSIETKQVRVPHKVEQKTTILVIERE
jgi:hypothetical protein